MSVHRIYVKLGDNRMGCNNGSYINLLKYDMFIFSGVLLTVK